MTELELIKIDTLEQYIKVTEDLQKEGWWFRGQPCASLRLLPGLYRNGIYGKPDAKPGELSFSYIYDERKIITQYQNYLKFTKPDITFIQAMFRAQHYGIKTRLLDFSENPKVALFFAIENPYAEDKDFEEENWNKDVNPNYVSVWCLNPEELNHIFQTEKVVYTLKNLSEEFIYSNQLPVAITPDLQESRIASQDGRFVLFGIGWQPLEWYEVMRNNNVLKKIMIKKDLCKNMFWELYKSGFTYRSVYPDEEGFAKDLNFELLHSLVPMGEFSK